MLNVREANRIRREQLPYQTIMGLNDSDPARSLGWIIRHRDRHWFKSSTTQTGTHANHLHDRLSYNANRLKTQQIKLHRVNVTRWKDAKWRNW